MKDTIPFVADEDVDVVKVEYPEGRDRDNYAPGGAHTVVGRDITEMSVQLGHIVLEFGTKGDGITIKHKSVGNFREGSPMNLLLVVSEGDEKAANKKARLEAEAAAKKAEEEAAAAEEDEAEDDIDGGGGAYG